MKRYTFLIFETVNYELELEATSLEDAWAKYNDLSRDNFTKRLVKIDSEFSIPYELIDAGDIND